MIVAIDFDGTIVENAYPQIGQPKQDVIQSIKVMKQKGHKLILWTCREGVLLEQAISFCYKLGIEFDAINDNLEAQKEKYNNNSRKVNADLYIDDKAESVPEFLKSQKRVLTSKQKLKRGRQHMSRL